MQSHIWSTDIQVEYKNHTQHQMPLPQDKCTHVLLVTISWSWWKVWRAVDISTVRFSDRKRKYGKLCKENNIFKVLSLLNTYGRINSSLPATWLSRSSILLVLSFSLTWKTLTLNCIFPSAGPIFTFKINAHTCFGSLVANPRFFLRFADPRIYRPKFLLQNFTLLVNELLSTPVIIRLNSGKFLYYSEQLVL